MDYSKGRYNVRTPDGGSIGRIDGDEFVCNGLSLLYRVDGDEFYEVPVVSSDTLRMALSERRVAKRSSLSTLSKTEK